MMGSWTGITLKEVGGASACGGLEAEGQEFSASCLSEALLNQKEHSLRFRHPIFRHFIVP